MQPPRMGRRALNLAEVFDDDHDRNLLSRRTVLPACLHGEFTGTFK
jgi:hypothetical protein